MRNILRMIILSSLHSAFCDQEGSREDTVGQPPDLSPLSSTNTAGGSDGLQRSSDLGPANKDFIIPVPNSGDKTEDDTIEDKPGEIVTDTSRSIEELLALSDDSTTISTTKVTDNTKSIEDLLALSDDAPTVSTTTTITTTTITTTTTTTTTPTTTTTITTTNTPITKTTAILIPMINATLPPAHPTEKDIESNKTSENEEPEQPATLIPEITASLPPPHPTETNPDNPLSMGMVGGIIGGGLLIVILIGVIVVMCWKRKNSAPARQVLGGHDSKRKPKMVQV